MKDWRKTHRHNCGEYSPLEIKPPRHPDKDPSFLIAYMPLNFGIDARAGREAAAKESKVIDDGRPPMATTSITMSPLLTFGSQTSA